MIGTNFLTIDVEDFFQVSAFETIVSKESWSTFPSRVEKNSEKILAILERHQVKATFFILGWTAGKHPELVKKIVQNGHEIGCHSYLHRLVYDLTPEDFYADTKKAKDTLEQITGITVKGYRAPSYSITRESLWAIPILNELGFTFDSSIFPVHHDRYGIPDAPRYPFVWDVSKKTPEIHGPYNEATTQLPQHMLAEYPISTTTILGKNIPISGGGYFRLFPYWFTKMALRKINEKEKRQFIFYLHPWEFDPEQPRFNNASRFSRFRHYNNLEKTTPRFEKLLQDFSFGPMHEQ